MQKATSFLTERPSRYELISEVDSQLAVSRGKSDMIDFSYSSTPCSREVRRIKKPLKKC